MDYRVCIQAAGRGSRVISASSTNKALLPVRHQAVLSHIIRKFPREVEIVIAAGHLADHLRDFLTLAFPDRKITLQVVANFDGPGSGPGLSLLCCRPLLLCPFIFVACDTLVLEEIPPPTEDWIGVAPVADPERFLVARCDRGRVARLFDKWSSDRIAGAGASATQAMENAFIGLAGVRDHRSFWSALARDESLIGGERQVSLGLNGLIEGGLKTVRFTWFDTGTEESYRETAAHFEAHDSLPKPGEFLYFEDDRVIKFFADQRRCENRAIRAAALGEFGPRWLGRHGHFYAYRFVPGQ
ncbi:MAG: NTP transferase domain-containing protein, partial [Candidatus Riflebacteria bacterium]|nr:NTP transferase domain-containing protein [Candidatus Riflebacteria bacterium]